MNDFNRGVIGGNADTEVGLKSFMLGTYRWMMLAMLVTAGTAWVAGQMLLASPAFAAFLGNPLVLLGFVIAIPFLFGGVARKLPSMSMGGVLTFLFGFAALMGVFVSYISVSYRVDVLLKIFFMTVALFGALSMFGYTTKTNLTPYLKFAAIGFLVFVGYMVLSAFIPAIAPTGLAYTVMMAVGLVLISVITAGQTQGLKAMYYGLEGDTEMLNKWSAMGAASLLLSFINMFQFLLALFGRD
ncbi:MAG: Bax inhibitor-1/YccA family protein [Litorimonas sp.]